MKEWLALNRNLRVSYVISEYDFYAFQMYLIKNGYNDHN